MRQEMAHSLPRTIAERQLEFKLSEGEAWTKAQGLRFSFEKSDELLLALYISRKINLLRAASIFDPTMVNRLIWEGVESNLSLITLLIPNERLDDFRRKIRDNESAARRAWDDRKTQLSEYSISVVPTDVLSPLESQQATDARIGARILRMPRLLPRERIRENLRPPQLRDAILCGGAHYYANRCPKKDGSNDRQANQVEDAIEDEDALYKLGPCPDSDTEPEN
ncbi:hypothetical protein ACJ73_06834 [Blastomyces percursus]|uniref:Uncharacterized protein n=1 Tax=Blastomyces percursus TaxID=1658174 RepID=A0A1J9PZT4_9EURO|nr:hypothetical protein ACJ73_06834 [Blastomyces percursus]